MVFKLYLHLLVPFKKFYLTNGMFKQILKNLGLLYKRVITEKEKCCKNPALPLGIKPETLEYIKAVALAYMAQRSPFCKSVLTLNYFCFLV